MSYDSGILLTEQSLEWMFKLMDEDNHGSFWIELKHMEHNDFDIARQKRYIIHYIRDAFIYQGISIDSITEHQERSIAIKIRRQLRIELKLPPLSNYYEENWKYEYPFWCVEPVTNDESWVFTIDDINKVANWIAINDPELVRYVRAVTIYNTPLIRNGGIFNNHIIRPAWADGAIVGATGYLFGPKCPNNVDSIWRRVWDIFADGVSKTAASDLTLDIYLD